MAGQLAGACWRTTRALVLGALVGLASPAAAAAERRVFVNCAVAQGNGFNWAATLGWQAAEMGLAAARADDWAASAPGRQAALDLACFTGSSSGSFAGAALDALLANPRVVSGTAGPGLVTPAEARALSDALVFLALAADFRGEVLPLALDKMGATLGLIGRGDDTAGLRPWRGTATATGIRRSVALWIEAAARYDPVWFMDLIAAEGPLPIRDRPARYADPDPPADRALQALSTRARRMLDDRVGGARAPLGPAGDGFCVTALVVPAVPDRPLPFEALDLVVACNAATIATLAASRDLIGWLGQAPAMAARLLLAASPDWRTSIGLSLREPDLVTPLSGRLDAPPVGLVAPLRFNGAAFVPADVGPRLVMGGFAGPRLQAWTAVALLADKLDRHRAMGAGVEGRLAIFGRPELRDDPRSSFLQRTIVTHFSQTSATGVTPELVAFHAWEDTFCAVAAALAPQAEVAFLRMDWNLSPQPAALTRQSRILAAKGFNLPRLQATNRSRGPREAADLGRFLHDPMDEPRFLPEAPVGGLDCRPGTEGF